MAFGRQLLEGEVEVEYSILLYEGKGGLRGEASETPFSFMC